MDGRVATSLAEQKERKVSLRGRNQKGTNQVELYYPGEAQNWQQQPSLKACVGLIMGHLD